MDDGRATSKSEIDRLGERPKAGDATTDDLRLLADYGARFVRPYVEVLHDLGSLGLNPSGRAPTSRDSIVAKLGRESIRMTQIQAVAGCRVVVPVDHEVVLLDATDEESLRRTHERYFQPVEEFAQPAPNA